MTPPEHQVTRLVARDALTSAVPLVTKLLAPPSRGKVESGLIVDGDLKPQNSNSKAVFTLVGRGRCFVVSVKIYY